jgi:hypothetical protein
MMNRSPAALSRLNAAIGRGGPNSPASRSTLAAWISEDSEALYCSLGVVVVVRFMPQMSSAVSSEGVSLVVSREAMHCHWPDWVVLLLLAPSALEEG